MTKIEVLYPEICNLYGDLANVEYLKKCLTASGEEVEIIETKLVDEPYFVKNKPDMIYIGSMSERSQKIVVKCLAPHKDKLVEHINEGTFIFASGNSLEVFGDHIECEDRDDIECLRIFNTFAIRKMYDRFNSLFLGKYAVKHWSIEDIDKEYIEVVGFKSQFTHSYVEGDVEFVGGDHNYKAFGLFHVIKGPGLNPDMPMEGIRYNNFMGTYVIGPIMILNPDFTLDILALMGVKEPRLAFEKATRESYEVRLAEFKEPDRGFYY